MKLKLGIVLATTAAGLLVATPMAFAGEGHHHGSWGHHNKCDKRCGDRDDDDNDRDRGRSHGKKNKDCGGDVNQVNAGRSGGGLINVSNVNLAVPINACNNDVISGVFGILSKDLTNNDR